MSTRKFDEEGYHFTPSNPFKNDLKANAWYSEKYCCWVPYGHQENEYADARRYPAELEANKRAHREEVIAFRRERNEIWKREHSDQVTDNDKEMQAYLNGENLI